MLNINNLLNGYTKYECGYNGQFLVYVINEMCKNCAFQHYDSPIKALHEFSKLCATEKNVVVAITASNGTIIELKRV